MEEVLHTYPGKLSKQYFYLGLLALLLTGLCLYPSLFNGWVNFDDDLYIKNNPLVGLFSWDRVSHIFSTKEVGGNYSPLVILSYVFDYEMSGEDPFAYHRSNYLLHLLNVALVFGFIFLISGREIVAFLTALLFGIHPMHIESVAWVSGRKDVLYVFFFLISLIAYLKYRSGPNKQTGWILLSLTSFMFALLSKSMAMTLPLILLLIDYADGRRDWVKMIREKAFYWLFSLSLGLWAIHTQIVGQGIFPEENYTIFQSLFVAIHNVGIYFIKAFIPFKLAAFHPFPTEIAEGPPVYLYFTVLVVLFAAYFLWRMLRTFPHAVWGLGLFLISLLPILQFVPFGRAIIADRYTYFAYIGLFYAGSWGLDHFIEKGNLSRLKKSGMIALIALFCLLMMRISYQRIAVWKDGESLWSDVINKYPHDYFGYACRGLFYVKNRQAEAAIADFSQSIRLNPGFPESYINRGLLYSEGGDYGQAMADYNQATAIDSLNFLAYINRAAIYRKQENFPRAILELGKAIRLNLEASTPDAKALGLSYYMKSLCYREMGNGRQAIEDALEAERLGYSLPENYLEGLQEKYNQ